MRQQGRLAHHHHHHPHRHPHAHPDSHAAAAAPHHTHTTSRSPPRGTRPPHRYSPTEGRHRTHPRVHEHTRAEDGGGMDGYMHRDDGVRVGSGTGEGSGMDMYVPLEGNGRRDMHMHGGLGR
eukprot:30615-Eustigmatos_ZCMA.PRE.1